MLKEIQYYTRKFEVCPAQILQAKGTFLKVIIIYIVLSFCKHTK